MTPRRGPGGPEQPEPLAPPSGSLERAFLLVRLLAGAGAIGLGLTELTRRSGLPHPTVHRLLKRMGSQGFVRQLEPNQRYALGPLAFELGLAAAPQFDIREHCRPVLLELARQVEDTVYLVARSGSEAVCLERCEGASPVRVHALAIGSRRPLGQGAGGLAILAGLPRTEQDALIPSLLPAMRAHEPVSAEELQASLVSFRKLGYVLIRQRITLGVSAVGVPVYDAVGRPLAAITVAATDRRLPATRVKLMAELLQHAARRIERALREDGYTAEAA